MANIIEVDTDLLRSYAKLADDLINQIYDMKAEFRSLDRTGQVHGIRGVANGRHINQVIRILDRSAEYMRATADDFENMENRLSDETVIDSYAEVVLRRAKMKQSDDETEDDIDQYLRIATGWGLEPEKPDSILPKIVGYVADAAGFLGKAVELGEGPAQVSGPLKLTDKIVDHLKAIYDDDWFHGANGLFKDAVDIVDLRIKIKEGEYKKSIKNVELDDRLIQFKQAAAWGDMAKSSADFGEKVVDVRTAFLEMLSGEETEYHAAAELLDAGESGAHFGIAIKDFLKAATPEIDLDHVDVTLKTACGEITPAGCYDSVASSALEFFKVALEDLNERAKSDEKLDGMDYNDAAMKGSFFGLVKLAEVIPLLNLLVNDKLTEKMWQEFEEFRDEAADRLANNEFFKNHINDQSQTLMNNSITRAIGYVSSECVELFQLSMERRLERIMAPIEWVRQTAVDYIGDPDDGGSVMGGR